MTEFERIAVQGSRGVRPWDSPDSSHSREWMRDGNDPSTPGKAYLREQMQREIDMCLNCKWPRCVNCLSTTRARSV